MSLLQVDDALHVPYTPAATQDDPSTGVGVLVVVIVCVGVLVGVPAAKPHRPLLHDKLPQHLMRLVVLHASYSSKHGAGDGVLVGFIGGVGVETVDVLLQQTCEAIVKQDEQPLLVVFGTALPPALSQLDGVIQL